MSIQPEIVGLAGVKLNDVAQGMVEVSPAVCGNWRKSWVMQIRGKKGLSRLPRGFRWAVSGDDPIVEKQIKSSLKRLERNL